MNPPRLERGALLPQGQGGEKRMLFRDRKQREKAKLQSRGVAFGGPGQLFGPPSSGSLQGHLGRKPRAGLALPLSLGSLARVKPSSRDRPPSGTRTFSLGQGIPGGRVRPEHEGRALDSTRGQHFPTWWNLHPQLRSPRLLETCRP